MRILVVMNDPEVPAGYFGEIASAEGHDLVTVKPYAGEELPPSRGFDAVVVLGGGMGAYDTDRYPFLTEEKAFLRLLVDDDVPVLGLCLGGQMLADALGGRAYLADRPEVDFVAVTSRAEDPLADALTSGRVVVFHRDTFDVPEGSTVLASSDRFIHGFRFGSAVGVQPHPEATPAIVARWADLAESGDILSGAGTTAAAIKASTTDAGDEMRGVADQFFLRWLAEVDAWLASA